MFPELGIKVDRNAMMLGIVGHYIGHGGFGRDKWEKTIAQMTNEAILWTYGDNAAREAREQEVADFTVGVTIQPKGATKRTIPVSPTPEVQLLQGADSLDIGHTDSFAPYFFDFLRDKNGQVSRDELKPVTSWPRRPTSSCA